MSNVKSKNQNSKILNINHKFQWNFVFRSNQSNGLGSLESCKSFTLIELLVTSAIIMIMLAVTISYSQRGEGVNKVNRMIERLSFDIRRISNLSTQTQEIGDKKICGWGIYFDDQYTDRYIVFSDFCEEGKIYGNKQFNREQGELYEEIKLTPNVVIQSHNFLSLIYLPPEPRLEIYNEFGDIISNGNITLKFKPGTFTKTLNINQLGMITNN